jgi:hypothetical protein
LKNISRKAQEEPFQKDIFNNNFQLKIKGVFFLRQVYARFSVTFAIIRVKLNEGLVVEKPVTLTIFGRADSFNYIYLKIKSFTPALGGLFIPAKSGLRHWLSQLMNQYCRKNNLIVFSFFKNNTIFVL